MTFLRRARRINSNATFTPFNISCVLKQIVFSCSNAGTTWTLQIQDKAGTPNILIPALALALGGPTIVYFKEAIPMDGGVDLITAGTTPGVVFVWLDCQQAP